MEQETLGPRRKAPHLVLGISDIAGHLLLRVVQRGDFELESDSLHPGEYSYFPELPSFVHSDEEPFPHNRFLCIPIQGTLYEIDFPFALPDSGSSNVRRMNAVAHCKGGYSRKNPVRPACALVVRPCVPKRSKITNGTPRGTRELSPGV